MEQYQIEILNSTLSDVPEIFDLYHAATAYMKSKNQVFWPEFSKELIIREIKEKRQWKIIINGQIACIWSIAMSDELIWGKKNNQPSIYIHRIATNPDFRGQNLVKQLVNWADEYCIKNSLKFIRMDTVGINHGLIQHYEKLGFDFLGTKELDSTDGLPEHYNDGEVCLFQREVQAIKK